MRSLNGLFVISLILGGGGSAVAQEGGLSDAPSNEERPHVVTVDLWRLRTSAAPAGSQEEGNAIDDLTGPVDRNEFVKALAELQEQGVVTSAYHVRASALTGHPITVRLSERKPTVVGVSRIGGRGGPGVGLSRNVQYQEVGKIIKLAVESAWDDRYRVSAGYEESGLSESDVVIHESGNGDQTDKASMFESLVVDTVVAVRAGRPRLLAKSTGEGREGPAGYVLMVCVGDAGD